MKPLNAECRAGANAEYSNVQLSIYLKNCFIADLLSSFDGYHHKHSYMLIVLVVLKMKLAFWVPYVPVYKYS